MSPRAFTLLVMAAIVLTGVISCTHGLVMEAGMGVAGLLWIVVLVMRPDTGGG